VPEVFERYFKQTPPFGGGGKKHEFPDAFVILAVEQWCKQNQESMYVVSGDQDFAEACAELNALHHFGKLDEFLDYFVQEYDSILYSYANQLVAQFESNIIEDLASEFVNLGFFTDLPEGEVDQVEVRNVSIIE